MSLPQTTVLNISYALTALTALIFWQMDMYIVATICLLIGSGVAVARPHVEDARLILDGTPVLLLFAVMFISASSMVVAVDQVTAFFDKPASSSCVGAERAAMVRIGAQ